MGVKRNYFQNHRAQQLKMGLTKHLSNSDPFRFELSHGRKGSSWIYKFFKLNLFLAIVGVGMLIHPYSSIERRTRDEVTLSKQRWTTHSPNINQGSYSVELIAPDANISGLLKNHGEHHSLNLRFAEGYYHDQSKLCLSLLSAAQKVKNGISLITSCVLEAADGKKHRYNGVTLRPLIHQSLNSNQLKCKSEDQCRRACKDLQGNFTSDKDQQFSCDVQKILKDICLLVLNDGEELSLIHI
eukprot:TRINITY_DN1123_c0_g1_i16.p1 TRINITY_DN1123_c0_g1~~TRINITY_DN1123_c0_g1_i16.p1  ORF type:complete len:241 (-),score=20.79 TRINITY_DN1123_c0_g1_i16:60-782(-)